MAAKDHFHIFPHFSYSQDFSTDCLPNFNRSFFNFGGGCLEDNYRNALEVGRVC